MARRSKKYQGQGQVQRRARGGEVTQQPSPQERELHNMVMGHARDIFSAAAGQLLAEGSGHEEDYVEMSRKSVDISLIWAREVLGVNAQRSAPAVQQAGALVPQPIGDCVTLPMIPSAVKPVIEE